MKPGSGKRAEGRVPRGVKMVGVAEPQPNVQSATQQGNQSTPSGLSRKKSMRMSRGSVQSQEDDSPSNIEGQEALLQKELEERVAKLREEAALLRHRLEFEGAKAATNAEKLSSLQTALNALLAQADDAEIHHQELCDIQQQKIDALTQRIAAVQNDTAALRQSLTASTAEDAEQLVMLAANLRANQVQNFVLKTRDEDLMKLTDDEVRELNVDKFISHSAPAAAPATAVVPQSLKIGALRSQYDKVIFACREVEGFGELFGLHDGCRMTLSHVLKLHAARMTTTVMNAFAADFVDEERRVQPENLGDLPPPYPHALNV